MIPAASLGVCVYGVVRAVLTVEKVYRTISGGCDRQFCYYTQAENYQAFRQREVRECTVQLLSGWVVARSFLKKTLRMRIYRIPNKESGSSPWRCAIFYRNSCCEYYYY